MKYWKLLINIDLKLLKDVAFTLSLGKEFHSLIVRGKNENWKLSFFTLGTTNLKKSLLPLVLLSLFCLKWPSTEKSVRLWQSLYIKDSLAVFLLVARVSQLSFCRISVTLALAFSELSPNFDCPFCSRDPLQHFHIRGLVGLRSCTPFLLPIWDRYVTFAAQRQVL